MLSPLITVDPIRSGAFSRVDKTAFLGVAAELLSGSQGTSGATSAGPGVVTPKA